MKISVSLSDADVVYLDAYVHSQGLASRSAALQQAVRLLRAAELSDAYAEAWQEWDSDPDSALWDTVAGDGLKL